VANNNCLATTIFPPQRQLEFPTSRFADDN
jgi:hypothetical protein